MGRPRQRPLGPGDARMPVRHARHGLTADEIAALVQLQGGGCAICGRRDRPLQLDHDHRHCPGATGCRLCVRGAVCHQCNEALKFVDDDPAVADRMAAYLRRTAA